METTMNTNTMTMINALSMVKGTRSLIPTNAQRRQNTHLGEDFFIIRRNRITATIRIDADILFSRIFKNKFCILTSWFQE